MWYQNQGHRRSEYVRVFRDNGGRLEGCSQSFWFIYQRLDILV